LLHFKRLTHLGTGLDNSNTIARDGSLTPSASRRKGLSKLDTTATTVVVLEHVRVKMLLLDTYDSS
jgi:hypothetical protein